MAKRSVNGLERLLIVFGRERWEVERRFQTRLVALLTSRTRCAAPPQFTWAPLEHPCKFCLHHHHDCIRDDHSRTLCPQVKSVLSCGEQSSSRGCCTLCGVYARYQCVHHCAFPFFQRPKYHFSRPFLRNLRACAPSSDHSDCRREEQMDNSELIRLLHIVDV